MESAIQAERERYHHYDQRMQAHRDFLASNGVSGQRLNSNQLAKAKKQSKRLGQNIEQLERERDDLEQHIAESGPQGRALVEKRKALQTALRIQQEADRYHLDVVGQPTQHLLEAKSQALARLRTEEELLHGERKDLEAERQKLEASGASPSALLQKEMEIEQKQKHITEERERYEADMHEIAEKGGLTPAYLAQFTTTDSSGGRSGAVYARLYRDPETGEPVRDAVTGQKVSEGQRYIRPVQDHEPVETDAQGNMSLGRRPVFTDETGQRYTVDHAPTLEREHGLFGKIVEDPFTGERTVATGRFGRPGEEQETTLTEYATRRFRERSERSHEASVAEGYLQESGINPQTNPDKAAEVLESMATELAGDKRLSGLLKRYGVSPEPPGLDQFGDAEGYRKAMKDWRSKIDQDPDNPELHAQKPSVKQFLQDPEGYVAAQKDWVKQVKSTMRDIAAGDEVATSTLKPETVSFGRGEEGRQTTTQVLDIQRDEHGNVTKVKIGTRDSTKEYAIAPRPQTAEEARYGIQTAEAKLVKAKQRKVGVKQSYAYPVKLKPGEKEQLEAEMEDLAQQRPELAKRIEAARELGDLRENAEYHAAKEALGMVESRIKANRNRLLGAHTPEEFNQNVKRAHEIIDTAHQEQREMLSRARSGSSGGMVEIEGEQIEVPGAKRDIPEHTGMSRIQDRIERDAKHAGLNPYFIEIADKERRQHIVDADVDRRAADHGVSTTREITDSKTGELRTERRPQADIERDISRVQVQRTREPASGPAPRKLDVLVGVRKPDDPLGGGLYERPLPELVKMAKDMGVTKISVPKGASDEVKAVRIADAIHQKQLEHREARAAKQMLPETQAFGSSAEGKAEPQISYTADQLERFSEPDRLALAKRLGVDAGYKALASDPAEQRRFLSQISSGKKAVARNTGTPASHTGHQRKTDNLGLAARRKSLGRLNRKGLNDQAKNLGIKTHTSDGKPIPRDKLVEEIMKVQDKMAS